MHGAPGEAIQDIDEAVRVYSELVEDRGRSELAEDLVASRTTRSTSLARLGRSAEAREGLKKAI